MKIQALSRSDVFATLFSGPQGLTQAEAVRRLAEYGPNEIREMHARSLASRLAAQFTHFLALLLWFAAALCFLSEYLHPGEGLLPARRRHSGGYFHQRHFYLHPGVPH